MNDRLTEVYNILKEECTPHSLRLFKHYVSKKYQEEVILLVLFEAYFRLIVNCQKNKYLGIKGHAEYYLNYCNGGDSIDEIHTDGLMLLSEKYLKSNRKPYLEFMDILESFRLEMFNDPKVVVGEQINRLEILDDRFLKISNKIRAEFLNYYEDMAIFPNELSRKSNQELFLESLK